MKINYLFVVNEFAIVEIKLNYFINYGFSLGIICDKN